MLIFKTFFFIKKYLSWIVVRWPDVELDLSKVTFSTICRQQSGKAYMRSFKVSIITEDAVFLAFLLVSGHLVTFFILYPVFWYWNAVNSYPILGLCMSAGLKTQITQSNYKLISLPFAVCSIAFLYLIGFSSETQSETAYVHFWLFSKINRNNRNFVAELSI